MSARYPKRLLEHMAVLHGDGKTPPGTSGELFGVAAKVTPGGKAVSRARKKSSRSTQEDEFAFQCRAFKLPEPARDHRFALELGRQWRFDFAFVREKLAVEIEGVVFVMATVGGSKRLVSMGRHTHPDGFREDCRKYAAAAQLGWTLLRFEAAQVGTGEAIELTQRVLAARGWTR